MKQLVVLLLTIFVFLGCTQKRVVEIKMPQYNQTKQQQQQRTIPIKKEGGSTTSTTQTTTPAVSAKETIKEIEPNNINEETITFVENSEQVKIAFIYPSKLVAKYANSTASTIMGYFSYKNIDYNLKIIDTDDESIYNIQKTFDSLKQEGITNVIALFTPMAINSLQNVRTDEFKIYLPLIEKNSSTNLPSNYIYGSISYEDQLKRLLDYSGGSTAMFYQDSFLGKKLRLSLVNMAPDLLFQKEIDKDKNDYKGLVKDYRINRSSLFMNTDTVKTSLILSQITANDVYPNVVLSTQLNFDPQIIELTQERDRDKLVLANSIDDVDDKLKDTIDSFGGNITYEWVDYSTLVGVNYLFDRNNSGLIKTPIEENKVVYTPRLFKASDSGFLEIK